LDAGIARHRHPVWRRLDTARFEHEEWDLADTVIDNLLQLRTAALGPQRRFGNVRFCAAYGGKAEVFVTIANGAF
jgi:hypothetical protein